MLANNTITKQERQVYADNKSSFQVIWQGSLRCTVIESSVGFDQSGPMFANLTTCIVSLDFSCQNGDRLTLSTGEQLTIQGQMAQRGRIQSGGYRELRLAQFLP